MMRMISNNYIKKNKNVFGLLMFFIVLILCNEIYRNHLLKETKNTFAISTGRKGGVGNAEEYFLYFNKLENRNIEINCKTNFKTIIEIGDTVWIKYSIKDPKIIEVIDLDYKKYIRALKK